MITVTRDLSIGIQRNGVIPGYDQEVGRKKQNSARLCFRCRECNNFSPQRFDEQKNNIWETQWHDITHHISYTRPAL